MAFDMTQVPAALRDFLTEHRSAALAFSGGADSAYLLYAAAACGCDVRAYYVSTPFQPQFELDDARRLASELNARLTVLPFDVLTSGEVRKNPPDRCYYCKTVIFNGILKAAAADGYRTVFDGTNASDDAGDRPGMRALKELEILSPLRLCGITKKALREYSRNAGLFTWNKPAYACLATRVPSGVPLTADLLKKIERAESALAGLGFSDFRVRVLLTVTSAGAAPCASGNAAVESAGSENATAESSCSGNATAKSAGSKNAAAENAALSDTRRFAAKLEITEAQLPLLAKHRGEILGLLKPDFTGVFLDLSLREPSV